jgi:hypothetical protein
LWIFIKFSKSYHLWVRCSIFQNNMRFDPWIIRDLQVIG